MIRITEEVQINAKTNWKWVHINYPHKDPPECPEVTLKYKSNEGGKEYTQTNIKAKETPKLIYICFSRKNNFWQKVA